MKDAGAPNRTPRSGLRKYPALAYLGAAAALALLLPSGLIVPQSGPPTLAEYAPVPGEGQGTGNVSEFGQANSRGGIGSAEIGQAKGQTEPNSQRVRLKAGTKRCVGKPPRQTEDPLSPPCIAFFDGDNGGATHQGVTGIEVRALVQLERTTADQKSGQIIDCAEPPNEEDAVQDLVCKSYMRFFNERYQTYGRTVHLYSTHDTNPTEIEQRKPFGYVEENPERFPQITKAKIMDIGFLGQPRAKYEARAPYYIGFRPDMEDQVAMAASYICLKLAGRPAKFSGNVSDQTKTRKFAIYNTSTDTTHRDALVKALEAQCATLVEHFVTRTDDASAPARLREANVTTAIAMNISTTTAADTNFATNNAWFPEWFVVPHFNLSRGMDVNFSARLADQTQWRNAFGLTMDYRRNSIGEQAWYRAYREGCPDCREPGSVQGGSAAFFAYDQLAMLFYGIQAAGPKLTPQNLDKGLHAIPQRPSDDPYRPAAYFAPSNYSFIKDAMEIWWDPSSSPPGSPNAGCYRLPLAGKRFRAGEWSQSDSSTKSQGPCQGDAFQS